MAPRNWSSGACGNGFLVAFFTAALYWVHSFFSAAAPSSASLFAPALALASSSGCSNTSPSTPSTMRPYMLMKRR